MITILMVSFYAAPDTSNGTREQTQGDKEVVQAAGKLCNICLVAGSCQWQL